MPPATARFRPGVPAGMMGRTLTGALIIATACLFSADSSSAAEVSFQIHFLDGIGFMESFPTDLHAEDLDGDGDLDIVAVSQTANEFTWYENDGAPAPAFTRHPIVSNFNGAAAPGGPVSVFAADLDGDDDMDAIFASNLDDTIAWYENDGAATPAFTPRTVSTANAGPLNVAVADVDGDGDTDVITAWSVPDTIIWYENQSTPAAIPSLNAHAALLFLLLVMAGWAWRQRKSFGN